LGFTPDPRTVTQLSMSWGTTPYLLENMSGNSDELTVRALTMAVEAGEVSSGDLVVVIGGSGFFKGRVTDTVRIVQVP
jgi:pyruvate kinase